MTASANSIDTEARLRDLLRSLQQSGLEQRHIKALHVSQLEMNVLRRLYKVNGAITYYGVPLRVREPR